MRKELKCVHCTCANEIFQSKYITLFVYKAKEGCHIRINCSDILNFCFSFIKLNEITICLKALHGYNNIHNNKSATRILLFIFIISAQEMGRRWYVFNNKYQLFCQTLCYNIIILGAVVIIIIW